MTTFAEHPSTPTADGALVRAYLAGDQGALEVLFRRYHPDVLRVMFAKTRNAALADDLAQDTMVRALRYLHTYDPARPFWPWLHKIAFNIATSECARRGAELPVDPLDGAELALPDSTEQVVLHDLVMECLATLPKRHQRVLVLRYVEDRDPNDIASLFGLKRNALEQLLLRARNGFAKEFRARNAAFVPGFAGLSHRLRRALSGLSNRLQYAGGTTFSAAGDFALGAAALTVGGIGIVTTFGAHQDGADPRAAAPRPGFTVAGGSYVADAGTGPATVDARALPGSLVTAGTRRAAAPPAGVGQPGADAAPGDGADGGAAPPAPGSHHEPGHETGAGTVDKPALTGSNPDTPRSPEVDWRGSGPAPDTTVDVNDEGATATVEDESTSGKFVLSDEVKDQGVIQSDEVTVVVADKEVKSGGSIYTTGEGGIVCDPVTKDICIV